MQLPAHDYRRSILPKIMGRVSIQTVANPIFNKIYNRITSDHKCFCNLFFRENIVNFASTLEGDAENLAGNNVTSRLLAALE